MVTCPWYVDVSNSIEAIVVKILEEAGKSLERWRIDELIRRALGRREGAGEDGGTELHEAVNKGDVEAAKRLLEAGIDPNARNAAGETPLHIIAEFGGRRAEEVVKLLLEAGSDVNARDSLGMTPLHRAALVGSADSQAVALERSGRQQSRQHGQNAAPLGLL